MTPHYADDWLTVYGGDARTVLAELPADSVDCIVTSPPYWGLRDYGTATWLGGDEECDHKPIVQPRSERPNLTGSGMGAGYKGQEPTFRGVCGRCGASRVDSQLGLEPTPEQYVANLVGVFRELRRVLKPTGTAWLNLGDTYHGGGGGNYGSGISTASDHRQHLTNVRNRVELAGLKPKDLVGIPWRVAFALQADGWYLRSDIIWAKPNPMPESVTDRPTKAHEYLFLLSKSARYYYDADAVAETSLNGGGRAGYAGYTARATSMGREPSGNEKAGVTVLNGATRNLRSVWTIATRPYPGAHFAVFPPELPERCIKAGSSERGVCPECGAPWVRVVERSNTKPQRVGEWKATGEDHRNDIDRKGGFYTVSTSTGWEPTCNHQLVMGRVGTQEEREADAKIAAPIPAVVLDPFAGSGTVGLVANRLSRRAVLIDLNPAYLEQQMQRNAQVPVGL